MDQGAAISPRIQKIKELLVKLEDRKQATLSEIEMWSSTQASFRPGPFCWSAQDVIDHLIKVEKASVASVRKELPGGHPVRFLDRIRGAVVVSVMLSPIRIKTPSGASMVLPDGAAESTDFARRWSEVRRDLEDVCNSMTAAQLRRGVFRHPIAGWMTIAQMLAFFSAHLKHHGYQLRRLRSAVAV